MGNVPLNVDYRSLDRAKNAFIAAARSTTRFAERFGFIPDDRLGGSANIFALQLKPFIERGSGEIFMTLLPEGLGTADDACPPDLTPAELVRFWSNIGIKTVSALTNDAAASGMQTILVSLYIPSADPEVVFSAEFMEGFLSGFVDGCRRVGCVYFSGETPQLKNKIVPGHLDIAGALFGLIPAGRRPVDGAALGAGDRIVLIESSGPHENGFTVLRELAQKLPQGYRTKLPSGTEFWEAINAPSVLYTPLVQAVLEAGIHPTAIENITGHGWQKLMRSGAPLSYRISDMLPVPEVFHFVQEHTGYTNVQLFKTFNCGAGMAIFVHDQRAAAKVVECAARLQLRAVDAGAVEASAERRVMIEPLSVLLGGADFDLKRG